MDKKTNVRQITMAKFSLIPFDKNKSPLLELTAELNTSEDAVFISFRINEGVEQIDLGNGTPKKERITGLWERTCFELFIKNEKDSYIEFNFSPVFEWNCFYFEKKGNALSEWGAMPRPGTDILLSKDQFLLIGEIKKEFFPEGFFGKGEKLCAGVTSVIKDTNKQTSYWALSHEDTRPNFHHFDSFKYKF